MCGIVGLRRREAAEDVVIEGLRRLEYRGYDSAGIALVARRRHAGDKRAGKLANLEKAIADDPAAAVDHRHRAHPLGHPRRPERRQRPPAPRPPDRVARRAQRHHRELRRAPRRARGRRRTSCAPRPTPRSRRTCSSARSTSGVDLTDAMQRVCQRLEGAFTLVAVDAAGPVPGRRRPAQLAAGGRARGRRELPRLRRGRVHRAHPRRARARPGPGRHDHPGRGRGHRVRRRACRGHALPRRLGPVGRREGRLRLVHAQGDLRAAARRRRRAAGPAHDGGRCSSTRCGSPSRSCATVDKIIIIALRHRVLRRAGREVRHRALDPDPVRGRAGARVPLPRPDPRPGTPWSSRSASRARPRTR